MERGGSAPIVVVVLLMIAVLAGAVFMIMGGEAGGPTSDEAQQAAERDIQREAPADIDSGGSEETRRTTEAGDAEEPAETADSAEEEGSEEELVGTGLKGRVLGFDGMPRPDVVVIAEREVSHRNADKFQVAVPEGERSTRFSRTATTGEDGRFAIADLVEGGGYELRSESKDGGIGSRDGLLVVESLISDIGDLGLRRGARVRGRVRTEAGAPVPGAKVFFGQIWNARPVQSDDDGTFDAGVLQPGRHQIRVEKSGVVLPNPITMEFIEGDVVDNLELVMVPASAIRGRVLDDAGRPLAGASVSAVRQSKGNDMMWFSMTRNVNARSDRQGRFSFDSLLAGEYDLSVNCPGYESGEAKNITAGGPPIDIELPQFATIHGVVLDAKTGQPTKPDGVSLFWKAPWGDDGDDSLQPFWSDPDAEIREDGSFTLGVNQAGLFAVEAKKDGFAAARSERFEIEKGAVRSGIVIRLQPGRSLSVTVVDKATRIALPGALVELRVAPDAPDAGPRGDTFLLEVRGAVRQAGPTRGGLVGREVSGETGSAEIQSIRNGRFELFVRTPGYCEAIVRDIEIRAGAEPAPVQVEMTPGGSIEGVVRDDRGQVLTAHGVVIQGKSAARREAVTESGGRYRADHLTPGRYKVTAQEEPVENTTPFMMLWGSSSDSNKNPDDYPVVVEEGGVATFDLSVTVEEPGALAGSVLWNGRPGVGLQVSASRLDDSDEGARMMGMNFGNMIKSDDRGMFEFRRLRPGRYRITTGKSWQRMFEGGEAVVQSGATARISVDVGFGGIRGRVVDQSGAPIAGASVTSRLSKPDGSQDRFSGWASRRSARTAEDGTFELEEMDRGSYTVSVKADMYTAGEPLEVDVQAQRITGPIELRMTGGGWIGVVFDSVPGGEQTIRLGVQGPKGQRRRSWTVAVAGKTKWIDGLGIEKGEVVIERMDDGNNPGPAQAFPFELKEGQNTEVRVRLN